MGFIMQDTDGVLAASATTAGLAGEASGHGAPPRPPGRLCLRVWRRSAPPTPPRSRPTPPRRRR